LTGNTQEEREEDHGEGEGVGGVDKSYDGEKPWSSINLSIFSGYEALIVQASSLVCF
jgi:hypothetical protein